MTRRTDRRCPRHPYGCVRDEHRNLTPPKRRRISLIVLSIVWAVVALAEVKAS